MADLTDSANPIKIYMDDTGTKARVIEAPSAAAASEVFQKIKDKEGPFNIEAVQELIRLIEDDNLKSIIDRDIQEINVCFSNKANKSVLLLCGSIIEVILFQILSKKKDEAMRCFNDLKRQKEPKKLDLQIDMWPLGDMLTVSESIGLIDAHFNRKAREITDYRNIIHPTNEVRMKVNQIENLAPISIELIKMLTKQLKND